MALKKTEQYVVINDNCAWFAEGTSEQDVINQWEDEFSDETAIELIVIKGPFKSFSSTLTWTEKK